jgi:hypothetical protein
MSKGASSNFKAFHQPNNNFDNTSLIFLELLKQHWDRIGGNNPVVVVPPITKEV